MDLKKTLWISMQDAVEMDGIIVLHSITVNEIDKRCHVQGASKHYEEQFGGLTPYGF